ncbi:MAG: adenylate/guanylate cyclase domain-containing protein [Acidobacteria bacterium]|nr:MAG: adenylate/guanylate cyclase domain-containing protein [Acidobacteriota bacterium]GIK76875.1 MAG: adenylate/guanylate cyclase domain-containing protein [Actinomycetes bacterium]
MAAVSERIDFGAEGLLDGLEGEERESRLALLERLAADGVELDELRSAIADGRLALLPFERMLSGRPRYTTVEVAERSGVPIEELERQWRASGIAVPGRDEVVMGADDLAAADRMREILDAGIDPDQLAELSRTIAVAMSQFAAASRQVVGQAFVGAGGAEDEVSDRVERGAGELIHTVGPTLDYIYRLHLREQLRHAAFDEEGGGGGVGAPPAAGVLAIAFADLVGFTRLGEELPPEDLGRVTGRLEAHAQEVAHGPVRLVKLIGDAAMLASADTTALLEALHELLERTGEASTDGDEDEPIPLIRAGCAYGPAFTRGGDYYGRAVNLASRITGAARPGTILVSAEVRERADEEAFRFSRARRRRLKGISGSVDLYRCRRREDADEDAGA